MTSSYKCISVQQSELVSLLRVISVLLIVSCHVMQGLSNHWAWVLNIGVQVFFCISAFLFGKRDIVNPLSWLKQRACKILIPYYVYMFIVSGVIILFSYEVFSLKTELSCLLLLQGVWGGYECVNHLWFLTWIMVCYLLTPLLQYVNSKSVLVASFLSLTLIALSVISIRSTYLFLYCIMYLISKNGIEGKKWLLFLCLLLSVITLFFFSWDKVSDMGSLYSIVFHIVIGLSFFLLVLNIGDERFVSFVSKLKIKGVLDKYSYEIYLTHHIVIIGTFSLLYVCESLLVSLTLIIIAILIQSIIIKKLSTIVRQRIC